MKSIDRLKFALTGGSRRKKKAKTAGSMLKRLERANSQSHQQPPDKTERWATGKQKSPEPPQTNGKRAPSAPVVRRKSVSKVSENLIREMNPPLRAEFEKARKLFNEGAKKELLDGHTLGGIVDCLHDRQSTYGEHAVATLARALNVAVDQLYDARRLYSAFPKEAIIRMRDRKNRFGRTITYSLVVAIAKAEDAQTRNDLTHEFFAFGLTVGESLLTVSNGMFLVQAALVIWWFLGIPLAVLTLLWGNGLALVCMGTVLLVLPRRLHFTKVHKQVDLTCLRVFLVAFTAYAVYYFWSVDTPSTFILSCVTRHGGSPLPGTSHWVAALRFWQAGATALDLDLPSLAEFLLNEYARGRGWA